MGEQEQNAKRSNLQEEDRPADKRRKPEEEAQRDNDAILELLKESLISERTTKERVMRLLEEKQRESRKSPDAKKPTASARPGIDVMFGLESACAHVFCVASAQAMKKTSSKTTKAQKELEKRKEALIRESSQPASQDNHKTTKARTPIRSRLGGAVIRRAALESSQDLALEKQTDGLKPSRVSLKTAPTVNVCFVCSWGIVF